MHRCTAGLLLLLCAAPAAAQLSGKVHGSDGSLPIEHAHVACGTAEALTDATGAFRIDVAPPCELVVTHPRYRELRRAVGAGEGELEIVLAPRQEAYEHVVVTADREGRALSPVASAATERAPEEAAAPPSNVTDLIASIPGVAETGQGGLFQTYAVRGISGPRLTALLLGVPVVTDRRAGASLSFIDPTLIETVEVVRGPASTLYVGAMGGVVQAMPVRVDGTFAEIGFDSQGAERWAGAGAGAEDWSVGIAGRRQEGAETPDGDELHDGFTQLSAALWKRWDLGGTLLDVTLLPSLGSDIGKDNTDYPDRVTDYPEERHAVFKVGVTSGPWQLELHAHPSSLDTEVRRSNGDASHVENEALDAGGSVSYSWDLPGATHLSLGGEIVARTSVNADETSVSGGERAELHTLDDAWQQEAALFASLRAPVAKATLQAGARLSGIAQANAGFDVETTVAPSAFVGVNAPIAGGLEAVASVGTGFRFPSLTERFFTGTTGRGGVVGNPGLDEERSLSAEAGLRYFGGRLFLEVRGFQDRISDYIEQVEIGDDVTTFVNLTSGTIRGAELDGFVVPADGWQITAGATWLRGRSEEGDPLLDIPANRARAGLRYEAGRWRCGLEVERRLSKDDPGDGEKEIPGATLVAASAGVELGRGLELTLSGANLLDETYYRSADRKEPVAQGRSLGVALRWKR